jgi:hypothetical protein
MATVACLTGMRVTASSSASWRLCYPDRLFLFTRIHSQTIWQAKHVIILILLI